MTAAGNLDWLFTGAAWGPGVVGALVLLWALFWDRARGRRRCGGCWYDMNGVPGLTCPECGRAAKDERGLARTRRKWRWLWAAALLGSLSYGAAVTPVVRARGWLAAIPSPVLVWIAPMGEDAFTWTRLMENRPQYWTVTSRLTAELFGRLERRELAGWQWQVTLDRFFGSHPEQKRNLCGCGTNGRAGCR